MAARADGGTPGVDYHRTSQRLQWSDLPDAVPDALERLTGSLPSGASPSVTSGFTGSFAALVDLRDGRQVFVKAAGPRMPFVVESLRQEALVLASAPPGLPGATSIGFLEVQDWAVLVLEPIDGHMPGSPWTPADVAAVHDACLRVAEVGTPAPPDIDAPAFVDLLMSDQVVALARALTDGATPVAGWPGSDRLPYAEIGRLTLHASVASAGDTLVHGDLRGDNILIDRSGRAVLLDWNWVGRGASWLDLVGLLPVMAFQGVDTDALVATSPLLKDADPDRVDCFVAAVTTYMLQDPSRPVPPGCTPALRDHQRFFARAFAEFLAARRGW